MASRKTILLSTFLTLLNWFGFSLDSIQASPWQSITSFRDVRRLKVIGNELYAATSGGLLIVTDTAVKPEQFTNIDGLGTTDLYDINVDAAGQIWIAGFGRLIRFDRSGSAVYPTQPGLFTLRSVVSDGDSLWCGSDSGLVLFSRVGGDGGGYRDRFAITTVNSFPIVYDVFLDGNLIWLATSNGLAVADRTNPALLKSPGNWTLLDIATNPELGSNTILKVTRYGDSIHVITDKTIFRMSVTAIDTTFTELSIGGGLTMYDMQVEDSDLVVYYKFGIVKFTGGILDSVLITPGITAGRATGALFNGRRWVAATAGEGLYYEASSGNYEQFSFTGLPGNAVSSVAMSTSGLSVGGFSDKLAAQYDGVQWTSIPYSPAFFATVVAIGNPGVTWIGTQGGGLWRNDDLSLVNYNDTNSTIVGNNDSPPGSHLFAWVTDMNLHGGYLFASVFRAYTGYPIAVAQLDSDGLPVRWDSLGISDGISDIDIVSIDLHDTVLAAASGNAGVFYCVLGPNPLDKSDDYCVNFNTANSFILSNTARVVRFSPEGELWVGTNFGVSRLDESLGRVGEIGRFVDVMTPAGFGPDITAIGFDSRGNAWLGSNNGLVRFDATFGTFDLFTTGNSDLVSNHINSLTIDQTTGDVYVATDAGLSVYVSSAGRLTGQLDSVFAFPNPYIIQSDLDLLRFNFAKRYTVQVYTVAGELIWEVPSLSARSWDGRNQQGKKVASGVYIYVLHDADGNTARGKVLLVRK